MFCALLPKILFKTDVTQNSLDKNPGAFNVFSNCGAIKGLFCLFFDIFKGFLPVFISKFFIPTNHFIFAFIMLAPVLGHASGIFNDFKGGKCIATSFGVLLGILPVSFIGFLLALIYILSLLLFKSNALKSLFSFSAFGFGAFIICIFSNRFYIGLGCVLISVTAIIKHRLKDKEIVNAG